MKADAAGGGRLPIVFVHGNGETSQAWSSLAARFRTRGYDRLFAIDLDPPGHGSCVAYAEQLAAFVAREVRPGLGGGAPLALVSHSLGAPVVRYYLSMLGGAAGVSHAVHIAGCVSGAPACDVMLLRDPDGRIFRQAPEIHTGGSPFLRALDACGPPPGVRCLTLSSPHDAQYLLFEDGPQLAGADNRVLPGLGHWGLRESDDSFALMAAFLEDDAHRSTIGLGAPSPPDSPIGTWLACEPEFQGLELTFSDRGVVTRRAEGRETQGVFVATPSLPSHQLDLRFGDDRILALYRLTISGDTLGLVLGEPDGPRPHRVRLPALFWRSGPRTRPDALVGAWRSTAPGTLGGIGMAAFTLQLAADGEWSIQTSAGDDIRVGGVWSAGAPSDAGPLRLDLTIMRSNTPRLAEGAWWGGLAEVKDGEMRLELPAVTRGAIRPQVIDYPSVLVRG
ncbi:hypothetical protein [Phenylobacterium sp. SCN 70-31]|uniref:hypothetical protein n=1 Tax=Phenylobacterium sp. SCN 70-31 TaxID=1660129 RepID=UPI00086D04BD|nr:hypothetical protein [Phenylobacterium sp. SCN 70-31]ODT89939.1 MAG: hypothetical protein ABS78_01020 [Phenylobacterium sp. SCN 70-31]